MPTVNPSQTSQEYILSVKMALDPEVKAAADTLARLRKELDATAKDLAKASREFAAQGGDATKAAESLRKYNEVLKGTAAGAKQLADNAADMKALGFDVAGQAVVKMSAQMRAAMKSVDEQAQTLQKNLSKFGSTGFDATGQAVINLSPQIVAAMKSIDNETAVLQKNLSKFGSTGFDATGQAIIQLSPQIISAMKSVDRSAAELNANLTRFGGTGFNVAGEAVIQLSPRVVAAMKSVDQAALNLQKNMERFGSTGFDVTGQAVVKLSTTMAAAMRSLDAPTRQAQASLEGWRASLGQLEAELSTLPQKITIVNAKLLELNRTGQQGSGAWMAYMSELKRLENAQRQLQSVNRGTVESFRNMRFAVQNTSFQLTDMLVQLQMGTRASVIVAQQVPQILGSFGAFGAAAGVVVALSASIAGPFVDSLLKGLQPAKDLEDAMKATDKAFTEFASSAEGLQLDNVRKQFNESSAAARKLLVATKQTELALLELNRTKVELDFGAAAKDAVGSFNTLDKMMGAFSDSAQRNADNLGITREAYLGLTRDLKTNDPSLVLEKYGASLVKGTEKGRAFAQSLIEVTKSQQDWAAKSASISKLMDQFAAAGETGMVELDKKTKAARQSLKDYNDEFEITRGVFADMSKLAAPQWELPIKIEVMEKNIEVWKAWGLTHQQVVEVIAKAETDLKKARNEWTLYDQVIQDMLADQEKIKKYDETLSKLLDDLAREVISPEQFERALVVLQKYAPALEKVGSQAKETQSELQSMAVAVGSILANSIDGLTDALLDSTKSFKEWAASVIKEISKVLIKMAALSAFKKMFAGTSIGDFFGLSAAGASAASASYAMPVPVPVPMAAGYAVPAPVTYRTGSAIPDAVVPLKRSAAGDVGVASSPVSITVNNTISDTAKVDVAENQKQDGSKEITLTIRREVRAAMADGSFDQSMRANYGLTRRGL